MNRRQALQLLGGAVPTWMLRRGWAQATTQGPQGVNVTPGPFQGNQPSLKAYTPPSWFADAKFGIWAHWGPQSAVGDGDWYARKMYLEDSPQYAYHLKRFGPQSKFGYKDTAIPLFTAAKWDPEHLMDLYQKAGAKYFFSMGVHHDNYDLWNSKYQPRWNSVTTGPKKDVVGLWAAAARRRGIYFGVSEHLSNSYDWFAPSHLADTKGPYAGVPYDGANPAFADLYHNYEGEPADFDKTAQAMGRFAPDRWKLQYFNRVKDLIDQHQPDLIYTDGGIPFDEYGLSTVAEIYNVGPVDLNGHPETVYFGKNVQQCSQGICVLDRERGVSDTIWPAPWQSDTCIGQWHYNLALLEQHKYKTPKKVIDLLVDIVSKNGNLLLNFPLPASGELDPDEMKVLEGITAWMRVNSEGIYSSRPWKINGEGPAMAVKVDQSGFNESKQPDLGAQDVRFTTKGKTLYAFLMGWPQGEAMIRALGMASPQQPSKVLDVRLLSHDEALAFTQESGGLRVTTPGNKPATADLGICLKVRFG